MTGDRELLRSYAEQSSQQAFATLVRRHLDFVYASALRQTRNSHRAEDVTQAVFTDLARKAATLSRRDEIVGWLFTGTRFAALALMRRESRRQNRERAAAIHALDSVDESSSIDWARLGEVLDEALSELGEGDREAILCRFFRNASFADVGARIFATEESARKRVTRALEKLRDILGKRGVTSTATALEIALSNQPVVAVPVEMASSVVEVALARSSVGATGIPASLKTLSTVSTSKIAIAVGTIVIIAAVTVVEYHYYNILPQQTTEIQSLQAENNALETLSSQNAGFRDTGRAPSVYEKASLEALRREIVNRKGRTAEKIVQTDGQLKPGMVPTHSLGNAGLSSPFKALQTLIWAEYNGNTDELAKMITFMPGGKEAAATLLARLPADSQAQFTTPESLIALLIEHSSDLANAVGYQVTSDGQNGPDPNLWLVHFQYQDSSGQTVASKLAFQQIAGNWMLLLGANAPLKLGRALSGTGG